MSAIYQRARPIRWDEVVGQEHVKDVLRAALEQGRVGHAYLFSGPRGVGKTTTARLIAMTANCTAPGIKPCGECESCMAVRSGNHPDVLEIDAASNNSVDDVRELREKVGLAAMRGGKKIYILDEAHMMSRAAFNALLKTLEEPPGHVIFILATTEPEKIIPTILSRCQHYRFRRLTPEEIGGKLSGIALKEGVSAEPEALQLIGRLADGAMRDGESLLERMLAAGNAVTRAGVEEALGLPPGERLREMAGALVNGEAGPLMQGAAQLYRDGYAARTVVEGLVTVLGQALHAELGLQDGGAPLEGADVPRLLRLQAALDAQDSRFARSADLGSLQLALTHALIAGEGSAAGSGPSHSAAPAPELGQRLARLEKELRDLKASGVPVLAAPVAAPVNIHDEIPALDEARAAPRRAASAPAPLAVAPADGNWADVLRQISPQLRAFLKPARMHAQAGYVSLTYDEKGGFHARQIGSKFEELSGVVLKVFGPVMLEVTGPTPDTSRKQQLGGRAAASGAVLPGSVSLSPVSLSPEPEPVAAAPAAAPAARRPAQVNPPDDIPPFAEARAQRAAPAAVQSVPETVPETVPAAVAPAVPAQPGPARPGPVQAADQEPPPLSPATRMPKPVPAPVRPEAAGSPAHSRSADPMPRVNDRHSPDDAAPAPLPDLQPAPPAHAAEVPPRQDRAVYIEPEPVWEEPSWEDLGVEPDRARSRPPRPDAQADARADDVVIAAPVTPAPVPPVPVPVPQPDARSAAQPAPAPSRPRPSGASPAAASVGADLRGHPLYQEATRLWSGRVREVGKVRRPAATEAETEEPGEETAGEEGSSQGVSGAVPRPF